jgi:predicted dehydrogenase
MSEAVPAVHAAGSDLLRIGLVGCGARGTGAAAQALAADKNIKLVALADLFPDRLKASLGLLAANESIAKKIDVPPERRFAGIEAYKSLMGAGLDVVLLAAPPHFRPAHLAAAVEAGLHVFAEKPVAVDAPGVRSVLDTTEKARAKNLSLVSGFCWRYNNMIQDTFQQVENGAIGKLAAYYADYYTNPVKPMPPASSRPADMSDVEWQIRNWYNFVWLCGDSLVEQAIHSADKIAWAMHDEPPVSCVGVGGRTIPAEGGNIYDHFEINYLYANGVRAFLANRQITGCFNENSDYLLGTDGTCSIGRGGPRIEGKNNWTFTGQQYNMYQREHDVLFQAIRKNQPVNNGKRMATSTMLGIMGRMAAYTGQQLTWDQAMNSQEKLVPENLDWNGKFEPPPRAQPGITKFI